MRASRLLTILMHLQERGRASAPLLAAKTSVSVRTIYRDVDHLSAAGVPIWAEPGRQGGICLRPGWRTQLTGLTTVEARALLLAGLPGPAADLGLGPAVAAAQPKLLAALPEEAQAEARRIGQRFHLDTVDWYRGSAPPPCLHDVAEAVWASRRVAMRYESWKKTSDRTVEPLGLVLKAGIWYLAARSPGRADPGMYRLSNVQHLQLLDETFVPPRDFDLAAWWRASTARFEAGLYTASARLRVTELGFERLLRFSPTVAAAAHDSAMPCWPDGWVEVDVPIESVEHAAHEMLRLGTEAEVLSPPALRAALGRSARQLAAAYAASA
jgi:predicted DNA-binding transcriptional regulator YafY